MLKNQYPLTAAQPKTELLVDYRLFDPRPNVSRDITDAIILDLERETKEQKAILKLIEDEETRGKENCPLAKAPPKSTLDTVKSFVSGPVMRDKVLEKMSELYKVGLKNCALWKSQNPELADENADERPGEKLNSNSTNGVHSTNFRR